MTKNREFLLGLCGGVFLLATCATLFTFITYGIYMGIESQQPNPVFPYDGPDCNPTNKLLCFNGCSCAYCEPRPNTSSFESYCIPWEYREACEGMWISKHDTPECQKIFSDDTFFIGLALLFAIEIAIWAIICVSVDKMKRTECTECIESPTPKGDVIVGETKMFEP